MPSLTRRVVIAALLGVVLPGVAALGERLPVRVYRTDDGLTGDIVTAAAQCPTGFLWIGTTDGLSRFDGRAFRRYGLEHGLPGLRVYAIVAAAGGAIWVATDGGLARLTDGTGPATFEAFRFPDTGDGRARGVAADRNGVIWGIAGNGLFQMRPGDIGFAPVPLEIDDGGCRPWASLDRLAVGVDGSLWIGATTGVLRRFPDGAVAAWPLHETETPGVHAMHVDRRGTVWIGTTLGLTTIAPHDRDDDRWPPGTPLVGAASRDRGVVRHRGADEGLPYVPWWGAIMEDGRGRIWVSTDRGIAVLDGDEREDLGSARGLPTNQLAALLEDRDGNVWLGTGETSRGLARLTGGGWTSFGAEDGMSGVDVRSVFEDGSGRPLVSVVSESSKDILRLDGDRFAAVTPRLPSDVPALSWAWGQWLLLDSAGTWWMPARNGVLRYHFADRLEDLAAIEPTRFTTADGLGADHVFRIYEDTSGDVWLGTFGAGRLTRWHRATGRFTPIDTGGGVQGPASAFAEDRAGHVWVGFFRGGIGRIAKGRFERHLAGALPDAPVSALLVDRGGRLWIGLDPGGAAVVDTPQDAAPGLARRYTAADGLPSARVTALAEDARGRILLGTPRGVARLDPGTGGVERFTAADGLAANMIRTLHRDRAGRIWAGTTAGLSRLDEDERPAAPPAIVISALRIGDVPVELSERGIVHVEAPDVPWRRRRVEVAFRGVSFVPGRTIVYRHRLAGMDAGWSAASQAESVVFAGLDPGAYRFEVAVIENGVSAGGPPASVAFTVLAPFWRQWWFRAALLLAAAAIAFALHRARVARVLAVQRERSRIAADLHDDLGARLSRISILSAVAERQIGTDPPRAGAAVLGIAETARQLIDSIGDAVWAIDPHRDRLDALLDRLRGFLTELFPDGVVRWRIDVAGDAAAVTLGAEQRRHLLLLLKEALTNAARHADAAAIRLRVTIDRATVTVEVADDGRGLAPEAGPETAGRGLRNMRTRAAALGADLAIDAGPAGGTVVTLRLPRRGGT